MKLSYALVVCGVFASASAQGPNDAVGNLVNMISHLAAAITNNNDIAAVGPRIFGDMRGAFTAAVQQVVSNNIGAGGGVQNSDGSFADTIDSLVTRIFVPITQIAQTAASAAAAAAGGDNSLDEERRRRKK